VRIALLLAATLLSEVGAAQGIPARRSGGVTVAGVVTDSVGRAPLVGAAVQLVPSDTSEPPRATITDSGGRYRFDDVVRGRYVIGFFHPMLDSLTLEPIVRELEVAGNMTVKFDLAIPAGARLRDAFCAGRMSGRTGGALVGIVRSAADGNPAAGAKVVAEWMDLAMGRGRTFTRPAGMETTSAPNGWFALCGVPGPGTLEVHAVRGGDTTDRVEVEIPPEGFSRQDLHIGRGEGTLSGRVVSVRGEPVPGAIVGMPRGARTRTDAGGEWSIARVPFGTRVLEVRAIGYYPGTRVVHVAPDVPPMLIELKTFQAVLDTVRIRASGVRTLDGGGFEERRRAFGSGRFLSEEDIRRRAPIQVSDLFRSVPGMTVEPDIKMRGAFQGMGTMGECSPSVFVDGRPLPRDTTLRTDDIDIWVRPSQIWGIEIYPDAPPPQFQVAQSGCGSIVIWTKLPPIRK
jgi:hypothetical protein